MPKRTKKKEYNVMEDVLEFATKHPGLLFIVGNPVRDELLATFGHKQVYIRLPITLDKSQNALVRMLNGSTFAEGAGDFLSALVEGLKLSPTEDQAVLNAIGGSVQSMVDMTNEKSSVK